MKFHNLILLVFALTFCIALASCGEEEYVGKVTDTSAPNETVDTAEDTADLVYTDTEAKKCDITIGGADISSFSVVTPAEADETSTTIAEYVLSAIKGLTGLEISAVKDSEAATDNEIVIGATTRAEAPELSDDEFIVKIEDGKLYIFYAEGSSAFQAVTTVLIESIFSEALIKDGKIALENGFEIIGKCDDYIIGDNEFNPFE